MQIEVMRSGKENVVETINEVLSKIDGIVWGVPLMVLYPFRWSLSDHTNGIPSDKKTATGIKVMVKMRKTVTER